MASKACGPSRACPRGPVARLLPRVSSGIHFGVSDRVQSRFVVRLSPVRLALSAAAVGLGATGVLVPEDWPWLIGAAGAVGFGLINRAVPAEALEEETLALARKVAGKSPLTLKIGKEAFYRQVEYGLVEAYAYASQVMTTNMLARDAEEGIDAFIEKRAPEWQGR